jgi:hypothetical protein
MAAAPALVEAVTVTASDVRQRGHMGVSLVEARGVHPRDEED